MPARFVEITIPVASGAEALGFVQNLNWDLSGWRSGWPVDPYGNSSFSGNSTAWTGPVSRLASRAAHTLANASAPTGPARWLLCAALAVMIARAALLQRATRQAVAEFGNAHAE